MKMATGYPSIDQTHKQGEHFFERHPIIPNISIYSALCILSNSYRNDVAINCHGLNATFSYLLKDSARLSCGLGALGIRSGEIITVCMPNLYQAVAIFFAANRMGATVAFLNEFSTCEEICDYIGLFHSPILINCGQSEQFNQEILRRTGIRHIVTLNEAESESRFLDIIPTAADTHQSLLRYKDLYAIGGKKRFAKTAFSGSSNALILFTSGTTGTPKSVVLTNRNILAAAIYLKNSSHISNTRGEKSLICVPFTYPYGFCTSLLMSLLCGRQAILTPKLSLDTIDYYIAKKPNIIFGSPALLNLFMRGISKDQELSSIKTFISGGDFLTPNHEKDGKRFFASHGGDVVICNGAGNAETTSCGTNLVGVAPRIGSVGRILTGTDAIIIDPDSHAELQYGEEGLLCISGKHVFKEYYYDPATTAAVKWNYKGKIYFQTGMLGVLDKEGYFTITGREARFYITSSLNKVYCDRVQSAVAAIDVVSMCAVVEVPDSKELFSNCAFVVPKSDTQPSKETSAYIMKKCAEPILMPGTELAIMLKPYEIPKDIIFMKELPRSKSDKIDYNRLKELALLEHTEANR